MVAVRCSVRPDGTLIKCGKRPVTPWRPAVSSCLSAAPGRRPRPSPPPRPRNQASRPHRYPQRHPRNRSRPSRLSRPRSPSHPLRSRHMQLGDRVWLHRHRHRHGRADCRDVGKHRQFSLCYHSYLHQGLCGRTEGGRHRSRWGGWLLHCSAARHVNRGREFCDYLWGRRNDQHRVHDTLHCRRVRTDQAAVSAVSERRGSRSWRRGGPGS